MVFYRKYRPQTIQDLDSKLVREKLYAALSQKDPSHAFLFTGPKGLGKTSAARIVAKVLNCENRNQEARIKNYGKDKTKSKNHDSSLMIHDSKSIEPCNICDQCVSITNGTNLDVLEIDGASNRGIDEIRDLREKVRLTSVSARKKVYIIDEVHMLTTEAFNALLKTLEEPPSHVVFVLCTTEPHKIPSTIISRCLHLHFTLASKEELKRSFKRVIKAEKLDVDEEALDYIAQLSYGGFRDGTKILEELAALSRDRKITKELVEEKFQISNIQFQIANMIKSFAEKNTKEGLELIAELAKQGVDLKYFIEQMIQELHEMLLGQLGIGDSSKLNPSASLRAGVQSSKLTIEKIKSLIELLTKAYGEMKYAVLPQLPLELVIIEWGILDGARDPVASSLPASAPSTSSQVRAALSPSSGATPRLKKTDGQAPFASFWNDFIEKVKSHSHSIAGILRGCSLQSYNGKELVIQTLYKFHRERLSEKKTIELLEQAAKEISGNTVMVRVLLVEK